MPRQPPAVMAPAATLMLYPPFSMAGIASRPISVTTAPTMPVAVAKTAHVTMVATASEPGTRAIARCRLLKSFSIRLARSTRYPMKTNSGIAISTSFDMTAYVRWTIRSRICRMSKP